MSKTDFIKKQLALKGIYDYTEQQFYQVKALFIDYLILYKMDKYTAFDKAFKAVFKEKKSVESKR